MTNPKTHAMLPEITFEKSTLRNGLDVIARRQPDLPIVAVNLWYHVGSKNEEQRQRGYAHLFEHLMFEGSRHYPGDFFKPLQRLGASVNGSTSCDRTNYFVDLPAHHLETALAMESDRMACLLPALSDEKLRIQKDVVKNEYRQNYANRPYGHAWRLLAEALYPPGHPYNWMTIGLMEDVESATRSDVEAFFQRYYVPANASLALVGDLDPNEALELADRYFGDIPGGSQALLPRAVVPPLDSCRNLIFRDRVELERLYLAWHAVPQFTPDDAALTLLAAILTNGRASRLYQRLVIEQELLQDVAAYHSSREIAGSFGLVATQRPGQDLNHARDLILAEIAQIAAQGPTQAELDRVKNIWTAGFVFALDNVGGFGGIADRLNAYNVYQGDPGRISTDLERFLQVTREDIRRVANTYLHEHNHVLLKIVGAKNPAHVLPLDRATAPKSRAAAPFRAPVAERHTLKSGIEIWLLPRAGLPMLTASAVVRAGAALCPPQLAGLPSLTAAMLDEGTARRTRAQIALESEALGTSLSTSCGWEAAFVQLQCLSQHADASLDLAVDLLRSPQFPEAEWTRVQAQTLAALRAERDSAESLAHRAFLRAIYPTTHPYHTTIDGTEETTTSLARDQLAEFHANYYHPSNTAWMVVGDFKPDALLARLEALCDAWPAPADLVRSSAVDGCEPLAPTLRIVNRPGAVQAVARVGHLGIPRLHPDHDALLLWNQILGGQFSSRLNHALREQKGYTYGIRSHVDARRGPGPFWIGASLQADRLGDAIADLRHELEALLGSRPPTQQELDDARHALIEGQARQFESPGSVVSRFAHLYLYGLPADYHAKLADRLNALDLSQIQAAAQRHIHPDRLSFVIVADAQVAAPQLRDRAWSGEIVIEDPAAS